MLAPRQKEILRLIAGGLTSRGIAARLKISFKTVVVHRHNLMRRLRIHDVVSLARYAYRNKLLELCSNLAGSTGDRHRQEAYPGVRRRRAGVADPDIPNRRKAKAEFSALAPFRKPLPRLCHDCQT